MSHADEAKRLAESPDALEASYDNGATWTRCVRASERNTAEAFARGVIEFVQHRSRRADYPNGAIFRWHGALLFGATLPEIALTGPTRAYWSLSCGFRVPTRNGRFRYFPTEDKAREFAAVIGASEIECSPRHALEGKREQEEQAKPWAVVVMSVVGGHVFGESRFDSESDARAEFEMRREHAKENGGAAQLKRGLVRVDGFNHFCPND